MTVKKLKSMAFLFVMTVGLTSQTQADTTATAPTHTTSTRTVLTDTTVTHTTPTSFSTTATR